MDIQTNFFILSIALVIVVASAESSLKKPILHGKALHCCTILEYPIVSPDKFKKYKYKGLAFDYLQELENRLGITCASMYEYRGNGTSFTQFTKHMERCSLKPNATDPVCKCELGVAGWTTTRERIGKVLFLPKFLRLDTDVLTHVDNTSSSTSGGFFVSAFTPRVWALIGLLFLLFTFVRMMDKRFEQPPKEYEPLPLHHGNLARTKHYLLKSRLTYRIRKAAFRTAMEMSQQVEPNSGMERNSTRQWVLTFGVMLAGLFFVLTYEATMTAQLVVDDRTSIYRTSDDFRKCHIDVNDICIPKGGAEESFWRNSFAHVGCNDGAMPRFIDSYEHVIEMVANKTCRFVISGNAQTGEAMSGRHCASVVKVGEPVFRGGVGAVMPINANMTVFNILRNTTLDLLERGELMSLAQYYEKKGECFRRSSNSLPFSSLRIFFYVAFSFIFVMFLVMIMDPQHPPEEEKVEQAEGAEKESDLELDRVGRSCKLSYDGSELSCDSM